MLPFGTPRTINAELAQSSGRWCLTWGSSSELSLRHDILKNDKLETGLTAELHLSALVPPEDREMLDDVLELFPGATIEFSCYTRHCGVLKRKTIIWEVRHF